MSGSAQQGTGTMTAGQYGNSVHRLLLNECRLSAEKNSLQQVTLGQLDIDLQKEWNQPPSLDHTQKLSPGDQRLSVSANATRPLEENQGGNPHDLSLG